MPEYTEANIQKLAERVVESWDMDTLLIYAVERLIANYKSDQDSFYDDSESVGYDRMED